MEQGTCVLKCNRTRRFELVTSQEGASRIEEIKAKHGSDLAILAHHYQHDKVVVHADYCGDSLELARLIASLQAQRIVMCGVYFMAESAAILAGPSQEVSIPRQEAGCLLSNMAPAWLVEKKLYELNAQGRRIVPLAYVNTSAAVKALCGRFGGSVCTSANAPTMLDWALKQGDGVLFLPDKNLGRNTAKALGVPAEDQVGLDLRSLADGRQARLFFWPGVCIVHNLIKAHHVEHIRRTHPEAKIIVHPECLPEVVDRADASGSTSTIIRYVREAEPGTTIYVGTEINLVQRLARDYGPDKTVWPVLDTACSNMAKITAQNLADHLENLEAGPKVTVSPHMQQEALLALDRMLKVCT
ncbi:MAG: quinolinate synthase NadA [Desulfovermiculus sp.]|nr:quinolinate synthase NadA [Desulfovermiculus sp.]